MTSLPIVMSFLLTEEARLLWHVFVSMLPRTRSCLTALCEDWRQCSIHICFCKDKSRPIPTSTALLLCTDAFCSFCSSADSPGTGVYLYPLSLTPVTCTQPTILETRHHFQPTSLPLSAQEGTQYRLIIWVWLYCCVSVGFSYLIA